MRIAEIAFDLLESVRASRVIDDDTIDVRNLYYWIDNKRAEFIRQNYSKYGYIDDNLLQTVELQLMVEDSSIGGYRTQESGVLRKGLVYTIESLGANSDFSNAGGMNYVGNKFIAYENSITNSDILNNPVIWDGAVVSYIKPIEVSDSILKSKNPTPSIIELRTKPAIKSITGNDLNSEELTYTPFDRLKYSGSNRFNNRRIFVSLRDNYIYVKYGNNYEVYNTLDSVIIRAAFQTPTEIPGFDIDEDDYPINRNFISFMKGQIINTDLKVILSTASDYVQNGKNG